MRQQWHKWDLDAFLPMLYQGFYDEDIDWIGKQVATMNTRLKNENNEKSVFSGLYMPHLPTVEDVKKAIKVAKSNDAKGICFFEYGNLTDEFLEILK